MKKVALITMMAVAVLGLMAGSAKGGWVVYVNIVNSAETPVMLSLANNDDAKAIFTTMGGDTGTGDPCILQPGQAICVYAIDDYPDYSTTSLEWNIIYNFYDGTDNINQRISLNSSTAPNNCASASQSGIFSASAATFVDGTATVYDMGDDLAASMGLSGTAETVVGGLIDFFCTMAGQTPSPSTSYTIVYAITIAQQDYNLDKLAGVDWSSVTAPNTPPAVTLVKGQQVYQYFPASEAWLSSQNLSHQATIADFAGTNVSIGAQDDYIVNYGVSGGTPEIMSAINFGNNQSVVQVSRNPNGPQCVAAFGDSSVWYYDGVNVQHLTGIGTGSSAILQMCVNWDTAASIPEIVVGCADGLVEHYNGTSWTTLSFGWTGSSVMQLSAYWGANNNLQVMAGLGNGNICLLYTSPSPRD